MLVNLNDVLLPAKKAKYAVGLFNAVNLELARGIIRAAEETQSPVIVGTAEVLFPYGPLEEVSYYLLPMAKKAGVPVVVHLDHGLNRETCLKALELGFSSIMYDCSTDSYEENVRKVKEMAEIAHSYGATIEGELGHGEKLFRASLYVLAVPCRPAMIFLSAMERMKPNHVWQGGSRL